MDGHLESPQFRKHRFQTSTPLGTRLASAGDRQGHGSGSNSPRRSAEEECRQPAAGYAALDHAHRGVSTRAHRLDAQMTWLMCIRLRAVHRRDNACASLRFNLAAVCPGLRLWAGGVGPSASWDARRTTYDYEARFSSGDSHRASHCGAQL